jgi:putative nucleotidyltransferase with HDIG domain
LAVETVAPLVRSQLTAGFFGSARLNVGSSVIVDGLIERLIDALKSGDMRSLAAWVETRSLRAADVPALRGVVSVVTNLVGQTTELTCELPAEDQQLLREAMDLVNLTVVKAQARTSATRHAPLDEVTDLIEDLVVRLDGADRATAEHSRAVSAWSARIATRLGLDQREIARVARGGLIHDIGKVTTPPSILLAPRKLEDAERRIMESHVVAGVSIIKRYPLLDPMQAIVESHHERLDGRGYPHGIPGSELPLAVRIVTVADSFNAMIGRRPYRRPFGAERALEELRRHSGTQFDAELVSALIDLVTRQRHRDII